MHTVILPLGAVVREEPLEDVDEDEEDETEDPWAELLEDVEDDAEPEALALAPELV